MIQEVNAVNFRQNLGEMITRVQYQNDSVIINKSGKPVAALIDAELFLRIRKMWSRFEALTDKLSGSYAEVPENDGMTEILQLVREERSSTEA